MIVISKKRIRIIVLCILLGILSFSFQSAKIQDEGTNKVLPTTATPVSGKVIVVDAGHGVPDERSGEQFWNN